MKQRIDNFLGGTLKTVPGGDMSSYTQNMYFESVTDGGTTRNVLRGIEGMRMKVEVSGTPRGAFVASRGHDGNPRLFAVFGSKLYAVDRGSRGYVVNEVGFIGESVEPVSMCETGGDNPRLMVADGTSLYMCATTDAYPADSFKQVQVPKGKDDEFIHPSHVTYQFGYLTINATGSDYVYRSCQYPFEYVEDGRVREDVFTHDPLNGDDAEYGFYMPADWCPDNISCLAGTNARLFTFGPKSMQVFNYTNDANMPFNSPDTSAMAIGILAPRSAAVLGNEVFWLGSSSVGQFGIYRTTGTEPQRISGPEMEREIAGMESPEDAEGFCWTESGHSFYAITFRQGNRTFVFDESTGQWHNRVSTDAQGADNCWRYRFPCLLDGSLCFMCTEGVVEVARPVYEYVNGIRSVAVEPSWNEHDGKAIVRKRRGAAIVDGFTAFMVDNVQFQLPHGFAPAGVSPKVVFRYSNNGVNFLEREGLMGGAGAYGFVTQFPRLGIGSSFILELSCSYDCPFDITGCVINWTSVGRGF